MKKYTWGEDPDFFGPQMYYRTSIMLGKLQKYINSGRVLDAGCGDGILSFRMAGVGFSVIAADSADKCINYIKKKVARQNVPLRLVAQKADLTRLPFTNNYVNAITCGEVLEHISEDEKVIGQFFRVLKKGGVCIITTPGKPALWHEIDDISGHVRRYAKDELIHKFTKAGFVVRECSYWGFPLNMLWHRLVFKPLILKKMKSDANVTRAQTPVARLIKSSLLQKAASHVFALDTIFNWTGFGEFLYLVAKKP